MLETARPGDLYSVGVSACPLCSGQLARESRQIIGYDSESRQKVSTVDLLACKGCAWAVGFLVTDSTKRRGIFTGATTQSAILAPQRPGVPWPECPRGHPRSLAKVRSHGPHQWKVRCVHYNQMDQAFCGFETTMGPAPRWRDTGTPINQTKGRLLSTLSYLGEGTRTEVVYSSGLPPSRGESAFNRLVHAKVRLIEPAREVFVPPNYKATRYKLTPFGVAWLQWWEREHNSA